LLKKLGLAFLIFTLCRILFWSFNANHFVGAPISLLIYGIRFDIVAIAYLFLPLIVFQLLPFSFRKFKWYDFILSFFFYLAITIGIILNLIDLAYFDFTFKRTTADFFSMIGIGDDFLHLLPHYVIDFWYDYVLLIGLIFFSIWAHKNINKTIFQSSSYQFKDYGFHTLVFIFFLGSTIIGMRGGLQYKPINIVNAGQYAKAQNIPIVLNTPFTIIKTLFDEKLKPINYFNEDELDDIYSPKTIINGNGLLKGRNVVVIILESFAKEYVGGFNNGKGYTPFIDSLLNESYAFTNAFSNGQRSIEALPSILAGLPPLMNANYVVSNYSSNKLDALPNTLKKAGYNTSFYHGGANGTMGFNGFVGSIGIDNYFGLNEYPSDKKEKDFDGLWGVFDEPYLQYYAKELSKKQEPFFSTLFTVSSHHPYTIPKEHLNQFPKGTLPLHETVGYTDFSLKQFFKTAKNMSWFKNTLFIFTSDHSTLSEGEIYNNRLNQFALPLFFYDPSKTIVGKNDDFFQQLDITPSVLSLLGIRDTIISFGNNAFSDDEKYVITFVNNTYQIAFTDYFLQFNNNSTIGFYHLPTDSLLQTNLIKDKPLSKTHLSAKNKIEKKLKAIIQQFNNRLINNKLTFDDKE
jgi:arylsulfatase A-like enzyme